MRLQDDKRIVRWGGSRTVLGEIFVKGLKDNEEKGLGNGFLLLSYKEPSNGIGEIVVGSKSNHVILERPSGQRPYLNLSHSVYIKNNASAL